MLHPIWFSIIALYDLNFLNACDFCSKRKIVFYREWLSINFKMYWAPDRVGGLIGPKILKGITLITPCDRIKDEGDGDLVIFPNAHASHGRESRLDRDILLNTCRNLITVSGWECHKCRCHNLAKFLFGMEVRRACGDEDGISMNQSRWVWWFRYSLSTTLFLSSMMTPQSLWNTAR